MSHALLLRLFLSPYFTISLAMHYLKTYPDSIGISHYLCWRMKSMPYEEVEFYWPQICHLLITRPTESNALESFVLQRCDESTHSAMLTFWFMQTALHDLTPTRTTNPRAFAICQRVLHRCHEIIFGDSPEPSRSPYRSLPQSPHPMSLSLSSPMSVVNAAPPEPPAPPVRVNPHAASALVGMGVMLAGAPGMPRLTPLAGEWAVIQGRRPIGGMQESRARVEVDQTGGADGPRDGEWVNRRTTDSPTPLDSSTDASDDDNRPPPLVPSKAPPPRIRPDSMIAPKSARPPVHPSMTTPSLLAHESAPNIATPTEIITDQRGRDPFSQSPTCSPIPLPSTSPHPGVPRRAAFHSVPNLAGLESSNNHLRSINRPPTADALLATYSADSQSKLLKNHYCRSEIRFLLLLEDISNRLLVIPKPARISALRAELTSLNHNLPAEVCMPLWCNADHHRKKDDKSILPRSPGKRSRTMAHSRVVRISPGDSVVLNSAERAPYLLHVEILEDDLDFDPTRRENRELLKKIVMQEDAKRRKRELGDMSSMPPLDGFGTTMPSKPVTAAMTEAAAAAAAEADSGSDEKSTPTPDERKSMPPDEGEEMDLVEQVYGNLSVRDNVPDLSDTLPLPSAPKNKQLDLEVWNSAVDLSPSTRNSLGDSPHGSIRSPFPGNRSSQPGTPNGGGFRVDSPGLRPATPGTPASPVDDMAEGRHTPKRVITLEDYSERMRTAAVMLAQLNASTVPPTPEAQTSSSGPLRWIPGTGWITGAGAAKEPQTPSPADQPAPGTGGKLRLAAAQAAAIRDRIMEEMMALEDERVSRMTARPEGVEVDNTEGKTAEDEGIVRREINKADPSAAIFKESWTAKKSRIRAASPWGHLANWDVISVIVKTGADLRQEQLATQLIERFVRIWKEEKCDCWARFFRILITGETSGLVETITDAVSVHSIKKSEYARRVASGVPIGHVSLMDHFVNTYGKPDSGIFARARRNFIKSLAGYSVITYLLQIKDRHNGNILVDRDGHLIHIDFGFMLSNSPGGNMGFEAAPFKMPLEYVEIMGGLDSPGYDYFRKLFKEGFEAARKHSDSLITIVELMQKDSKLDCFTIFGENTVNHFRERFALGLTTQAVDAYLDRLIVSSTGSNYTRLYDTFQYYSQGVL